MRRLVWILPLLVAGLVAAAAATMPFWYHEYKSQVLKEYSFVLTGCEFDYARKVMVRTNASERLVKACGARIVERRIDGLDFSTNRLINGNWNLAFQASFLVAAQSPKGELYLPLQMTAHVQPQRLRSTASLTRQTEYVKGQQTVLDMQPSGKSTLVRMRIYLDIRFHAPMWKGIQKEVDRRLTEAVDQAATNMRAEMAKVMGEYRGQKLFLKLM